MTAGRTVVHLLRHGEVYNPRGLLYGRLPGFGLSEAGRRMAQAAADALAGRPVVHLVSSPLQRAQETARPVAEEFGLTVGLDDRLIEPTNVFEGRRLAERAEAVRRPATWWYLRNPFRPSWGEPYREIAERVLAAVADARVAAAGAEAVLVSHQLAIEVTRRSLESRPLWHRPDRRQCALASLTSLTYDGDDLVEIDYRQPAGSARQEPGPGA